MKRLRSKTIPRDAPAPGKRRLRSKTNPRDARALGKRKSRSDVKPTDLRQAVRQGQAPKARQAFALFTRDYSQGKGDVPSKALMVRVSRAWRELDEAAREKYKSEAMAEKTAQRAAAIELGIKVRRGPPNLTTPQAAREPAVRDPMLGIMFGGAYICEAVASAGSGMIGRGTFGRVMVATHRPSGRKVALKIFERPELQDSKREVRVYEALKACGPLAPFLPCLDACTFPPLPWLSLPFVEEGSLARHLKKKGPMPEADITAAALQTAIGLWHLHQKGFCHLDIKPGNLLWRAAERRLFIIDFGLAEPFHQESAANLISKVYATEAYRPPELWGAPAIDLPRLLGPAVDVWSYGCAVYEMATAQPLMAGIHTREIRTSVVEWCQARRSDQESRANRAVVLRIIGKLRRAPRLWWPIAFFCCTPSAAERTQTQESAADWLGGLRARRLPRGWS